MLYLILLLICFVTLGNFAIDGINSKYNSKIIERQLLLAIIMLLSIIFPIKFIKSDLMCNIHMKAYERGEIQKEYTIIGTDTTYQYIYHKGNK